MIVGKAIYHLLTNATAVTDIVGTRIYPEVAQQDGDLPYIVYNITNNEPSDTKPEPSKLDTAGVEVNCYATSYTQAIDISVAVRGALDRVKGTYNGVNVQSIQYINEIIDFDEPQRAYNISADYEVRISRTDFEIAQGSPITGVELGDLSDVNVSGVTDNQILSYDAATGNWVPAADAGGANELNDLSDVVYDLQAIQDGDILAWEAQGQRFARTTLDLTTTIAALTDVNLTLLSSGEILKYDGSEWINDTIAISDVSGLQAALDAAPDNLRELTDVTISTPADGDYLQYDSAANEWQNSSLIIGRNGEQYTGNYDTEAGTLRSGATETVELYYTAQADGDGLSESASSDTPTSGYDIRRKLYYAEKAQADPDTSGDWTQFTAIADNTTFNNAKAALLAYLKERTGGTIPISLKMTWEEVSQVSYLLDDYSGAAAAYSLRLLSSTYSGDAINVWNGTSYADIGFDGSGELDTTALAAHCGSNDGFIRYWYDQSGNSNTAAQTTTSKMPKIYDGTTGVITENGKPAIDLNIANASLYKAVTLSDTGDDFVVTALAVAQVNNTIGPSYGYVAGIRPLVPQGTVDSYDLSFENQQTAARYQGGNTVYNEGDGQNQSVFMSAHISTNSVSVGRLNGSDTTVASSANIILNMNANSGFVINGGNSARAYSDSLGTTDARIQEVVFYFSDKYTNDRTGIEDNINTFYSIY